MASSTFSNLVFLLFSYLTVNTIAISLEGRGLGIWTISDFRVFTASSNSNAASSISFRFPNGTRSMTTCTRQLSPGSSKAVADPLNFYLCDDSHVSFKFAGTWLAVTTVYTDKDGSVTTNFGNTSISQHCYSVPSSIGSKLAGQTCESPTPQLSMPLIQSTIVSNTETMPVNMKNRIVEAMAQISTQSSAAYRKGGLSKKEITPALDQASDLETRQLSLSNVGDFVIHNFRSHNYVPQALATSDVAFDATVLNFTTPCSASRAVGQGSAATGGFQACAFPLVQFDWRNPLSVGLQATVPFPDGVTRNISANADITGFCISEAANGQNQFAAGNRCAAQQSEVRAPITRVVDAVPEVAPQPVPAVMSSAVLSVASAITASGAGLASTGAGSPASVVSALSGSAGSVLSAVGGVVATAPTVGTSAATSVAGLPGILSRAVSSALAAIPSAVSNPSAASNALVSAVNAALPVLANPSSLSNALSSALDLAPSAITDPAAVSSAVSSVLVSALPAITNPGLVPDVVSSALAAVPAMFTDPAALASALSSALASALPAITDPATVSNAISSALASALPASTDPSAISDITAPLLSLLPGGSSGTTPTSTGSPIGGTSAATGQPSAAGAFSINSFGSLPSGTGVVPATGTSFGSGGAPSGSIASGLPLASILGTLNGTSDASPFALVTTLDAMGFLVGIAAPFFLGLI